MIGDVAGRIVSPEFVGRTGELDTLVRLLDDAWAGRPRTALIGGEAGIGKSRLLAEALAAARARGAKILAGGSVGLAEGSLPFAPIVEALRPLIRAADGEPSAEGASPGAFPAEGIEAARAVAVELGVRAATPTPVEAAELRPEWTRSRLYEAVLELLRRLAEASPLVVAIEDLHWADDATRELLAFLVRNLRDERLLLIVTFRSDELHRRHPLLPWLAEMDRAAGVERIELKRLTRDDVARQLAAILGEAPGDELTGTVFARSEGNPFYAEELLAAGAGSRRLPPTLREVLAARLTVVSDATLRVLGVAAVAGRRVDHDLLAAVAGIDEDRLLDALHEATSAQLLVADEDALSERYTFRHALIGEAAAETVLPGERRRLHVAIAGALEADTHPAGPDRAVRLVEIAHHWSEARETARAFPAALAAADAAFESHAYAASQQQFELALELWDLVPDAASAAGLDRVELLRRTARSAQLAGDYGRARAHLRQAIDALDPAVDAPRAGVLHERLGRAYWTDGKLNEALVEYARAVEIVPASPASVDRARVLAGHAQVLTLVGRHTEPERVAIEAIEMARALGHRQTEGHAEATLGVALSVRGDIEGAIEHGRRGLALAMEVKDYDDVGRGYANLASTYGLAGRFDEAIAVALEGAAMMRRVGLFTTYGTFILLNAADAMYERGRWGELDDLLAEVIPIATGVARMYGLQVQSRLLVGRGDFDAARERLATLHDALDTTADAQFNGPLTLAQLELAAWTADTDGGRAAADRGLGILDVTEDVAMYAAVVAAAMRIEADAAERARAGRDREGERTAVERATALRRGLADRLATGPSVGLLAIGVAARGALADAELGRVTGGNDPESWRTVLDAAEGAGTLYVRALTAWRLAEALLDAREDRAPVARLLEEAIAEASRLGARPLLEVATGLAARARIPLAGVSPSAAESTGPGPSGAADGAAYELTPRELEVLRLLAAGRTNRQIAEELFISESTAGVHVSHILGKLGVGGRVEAAAIAVRLGIAV
jgi:DNA-binding CsgD family transcriptional regulator